MTLRRRALFPPWPAVRVSCHGGEAPDVSSARVSEWLRPAGLALALRARSCPWGRLSALKVELARG